MKEIIDGFLKFQREAFPKREALFKQLATQQSPRTLFISCSDSRLVPELVTFLLRWSMPSLRFGYLTL